MTQSNCNSCNKVADLTCGRCKIVQYCSRECQKNDWKKHKVQCFAPGSQCTRCLQSSPFPSSLCRVPHPNHLLESQGSMYGGNGWVELYGCKACLAQFKMTGENRGDLKITNGQKWCYEGPHTIKDLDAKGDDRRIFADLAVITGSPTEMNERIRALDGNQDIKVLKLQGDCDGNDVILDISLPNLKEVQFHDVGMERIVLNQELTPNVEKIWMQNPSQSDEPDFTILCPKLKECSIYYWGPGDFEWVLNMLETATLLETFDSYKLRVDYLKFASNHLRSIRLHRAELLGRIDLWAPRLTNLNLQAAYDLQEVHFLKDHALKKDLPENFRFSSALNVDSTNAILGEQAVKAILAHPRFRGTKKDLENDFDDF